jgi:hypothetical protein
VILTLFSFLLNPPVLLTPTFLPRLPSSGAITRNAAQLAPTKALKNKAHATPHTAPQPLPVVESQLAHALAGGGDACQNGIVTAARADAKEEAGRSGTDVAAWLDAKVEAGRGDADSAT